MHLNINVPNILDLFLFMHGNGYGLRNLYAKKKKKVDPFVQIYFLNMIMFYALF